MPPGATGVGAEQRVADHGHAGGFVDQYVVGVGVTRDGDRGERSNGVAVADAVVGPDLDRGAFGDPRLRAEAPGEAGEPAHVVRITVGDGGPSGGDAEAVGRVAIGTLIWVA
nr:hypothetical protein [Halobellus ruber]